MILDWERATRFCPNCTNVLTHYGEVFWVSYGCWIGERWSMMVVIGFGKRQSDLVSCRGKKDELWWGKGLWWWLVAAYERTYGFDWLVLMNYFLGSFCRVFRWILVRKVLDFLCFWVGKRSDAGCWWVNWRQRVENHGGGLLEDSDESSSVTNSGYGWKNGLVLFGGFMRGFDCSE